MIQQLRTATFMLVLMTVLTGGIYPLVVTSIAQICFPVQANGSLIYDHGRIVGSELIGQQYSRPEYFWGRLSATAPGPCNAAASSGSNYGPLHPALKEAAATRIASLESSASHGRKVPVDLVTSSASGLDPHISPAAAEFQVPRIAAARGIPEHLVRVLINDLTQRRQFGCLGEPRVNVLLLNRMLDGKHATIAPAGVHTGGAIEMFSRRPLGE